MPRPLSDPERAGSARRARRSGPRELRGATVVVTGASSGVGRATAEAFARRGASLVLAARTTSALAEAATSCRSYGVAVTTVATDVAEPAAVEALRARAVEEHGRIDVWVNVAAVLTAGVYGDETVDELERLLRTNVFGTALCARAAVQQFRAQERGVLIDVSSLLGLLPNPLVPSYVMSKFAVRGLSLSLHELASAWPDIDVCVVLPGPIDTPMFERAANHTGRRIRAIPPAIAPERVAARIVSCARRPRRQVTVGFTGHALLLAHRLAPRATEWTVARAAATLLVTGRPAPEGSGALFEGRADGRISGGWRIGRLRRHVGRAVGRGSC